MAGNTYTKQITNKKCCSHAPTAMVLFCPTAGWASPPLRRDRRAVMVYSRPLGPLLTKSSRNIWGMPARFIHAVTVGF